MVNFKVKGVDDECERGMVAGLKIHVALRDEPFGQRHCATEDSNGVAIDVIKPNPPTTECAAQLTLAGPSR